MTAWIPYQVYRHRVSNVEVTCLAFTFDGRPVVERHTVYPQGHEDWTCYDLARNVMDQYDHVRDRSPRRGSNYAGRRVENCERECERRGECSCG